MTILNSWLAHDLESAGSAHPFESEANHRIGNNLTIVGSMLRQQATSIATQTRTFTAAEVAQIINEASQRISIVGRFHRLLASTARQDALGLAGYLQDVAEAAVESMSEAGQAVLEPVSAEHCEAPTGQALLVGLIVGELVTNALKYAHPAKVKGRIRVGCRRIGGRAQITVADDGVGLPEGFDVQTGGGMGMRMVRLLAAQLRADLTFESTDIGLTVRLLLAEDAASAGGEREFVAAGTATEH